MKLINYEPAEIIQLEQESKRIWMTDIYSLKFFNGFVRGQIKNDNEKGNNQWNVR